MTGITISTKSYVYPVVVIKYHNTRLIKIVKLSESYRNLICLSRIICQ